jgi:ribosomal-protein-alanine N-acetyltransferase
MSDDLNHEESGPVELPTLETPRLKLRALSQDDAPTIARLAGRREIADTTLSIPHPYSDQQAKEWIERTSESWNQKKGVVFAVVSKADGQLVGTVGLAHIEQEHSQAELGYWIAVDHWSLGYATEASEAVIRFGFEMLRLNRIYAHHMLRNPASGRVMEKLGMQKEGILRERLRKWEVFEDVALYAVLKRDRPTQGT